MLSYHSKPAQYRVTSAATGCFMLNEIRQAQANWVHNRIFGYLISQGVVQV